MAVLKILRPEEEEAFHKEDKEIAYSCLDWGGIALHYAHLSTEGGDPNSDKGPRIVARTKRLNDKRQCEICEKLFLIYYHIMIREFAQNNTFMTLNINPRTNDIFSQFSLSAHSVTPDGKRFRGAETDTATHLCPYRGNKMKHSQLVVWEDFLFCFDSNWRNLLVPRATRSVWEDTLGTSENIRKQSKAIARMNFI